MGPEELNGATLAYLGDAVLEIMVRERVISGGYTNTGKLNELALRYVRATEQSKAVDNIIGLLDDEELSFYRRGKNAKVNTLSPLPPKNTAGRRALRRFSAFCI